MLTIDLIYDLDCPNLERARSNLSQALAETGIPARRREWVRTAPRTRRRLRRFGSPAILVQGQDVASMFPLDGAGACRIYTSDDGHRSWVPTVEMIARALRRGAGADRHPSGRWRWAGSLALVPGMVAAFLPTLSCPACWPAYVGLLSSLGIGFLSDSENLRLLTLGLLGAALGLMAYGARRRRRYGPLLLAAAGSVAMALAKFVFLAPLIAYVSVGLILAALFWNALPKKANRGSCPYCKPAGPVPSSTVTTQGGL